MSNVVQADTVASMRRRRLEREALGSGEPTPLEELVVGTLYAAGICMILAALFL